MGFVYFQITWLENESLEQIMEQSDAIQSEASLWFTDECYILHMYIDSQ